MNYITDGTFWVCIIVIVISIVAIYATLKNKIDKTNAELERIKKIIIDSSRAIAKVYDAEDKYNNEKCKKDQREKSFVLNTFADIYEILSILQKNTTPKDRAKIDKIAKRTNIDDYDL